MCGYVIDAYTVAKLLTFFTWGTDVFAFRRFDARRGNGRANTGFKSRRIIRLVMDCVFAGNGLTVSKINGIKRGSTLVCRGTRYEIVIDDVPIIEGIVPGTAAHEISQAEHRQRYDESTLTAPLFEMLHIPSPFCLMWLFRHSKCTRICRGLKLELAKKSDSLKNTLKTT